VVPAKLPPTSGMSGVGEIPVPLFAVDRPEGRPAVGLKGVARVIFHGLRPHSGKACSAQRGLHNHHFARTVVVHLQLIYAVVHRKRDVNVRLRVACGAKATSGGTAFVTKIAMQSTGRSCADRPAFHRRYRAHRDHRGSRVSSMGPSSACAMSSADAVAATRQAGALRAREVTLVARWRLGARPLPAG
jgi:hypothetical protein